MIEREYPIGRSMAQTSFPCVAWVSDHSIQAREILSRFLELRPNENWVLVGQDCVQTPSQLWTAWNCASRRWLRSTALARSYDAEFLRYLSGTHHVSEAFKRAGMRDEDRSGFLLHLPEPFSNDAHHSDCYPEAFDNEAFERTARELVSSLGFRTVPVEFVLTTRGASRLGMKFEFGQEQLTEASLLGHIVSAEFTS